MVENMKYSGNIWNGTFKETCKIQGLYINEKKFENTLNI